MFFTRALLPVVVTAVSAASVDSQAPNYGSRVAVGDGVVFVAEPANIARPGLVYAYTLRDGKWTEAARLKGPEAAAGDRFGSAVAAHGTMLLAAHVAEQDGRGAVHVFERRGAAWQNTARIAVSDAAAHDSIGISLALHENLAAIGAVGSNKAGAVYVFRRGSDARWSQVARLTASDAQPGDRFGASIALDGSRLLVGAPLQAKVRGGAYLFARDAAGNWKEEARLVARTVKEGDALGAAVALFGERAIVSAPQRDENTGAVYIFEKNPAEGGWAAFTRLFPFEGSSQSRFGSSLQVVGNEVWVAAPGSDGGDGAIHRFQWDTRRSDWMAAQKLNYPDVSGVAFASAFAAAGAIAVAGLPGDDFGIGTAVVFARDGSGDWKPQDKIWGEQDAFQRVTGKPVTCTGGRIGNFECGNVELQSFLPANEMGGKRGVEVNGIWGWTDPTTNREYVIAGRMDGTSFVDVTDALNPKYLGNLPMTPGSQANYWREIKVYNNHAFIVADGAGKHGMQVFDLTQLRDVKNAPVTFKETAHYDGIQSAHNIVINEDKGIAFATGANGGGQTCGGGLHMIDIRDPRKPKFAGCFADTQTGLARTGYTHDAQCVTYKGPDEKYHGREICLSSNETALSVADVTERSKPIAISRASYPNVAYAHQGWLTEDQRFFYMNDEGDEMSGTVPRTRTIIWDVSDLDDPQVVAEFLGTTRATDHNLYIKGDTMYQSNYVAGLRIIDISDRKNPREVGFFDSVPNSPNEPSFNGTWSNYPFFKSGNIVFVSGREGLFIVRPSRPVS